MSSMGKAAPPQIASTDRLLTVTTTPTLIITETAPPVTTTTNPFVLVSASGFPGFGLPLCCLLRPGGASDRACILLEPHLGLWLVLVFLYSELWWYFLLSILCAGTLRGSADC